MFKEILSTSINDTVGDAFRIKGGIVRVNVTADNYGSGNVYFEESLDGGTTWAKYLVNVQDESYLSITDDCAFQLNGAGDPTLLRAGLENATAPSNVLVQIEANVED